MFIKRNLKFIYIGILAAVMVYASWPLFGAGFIPTHDGEYHIIRFWQFFKMLSAGYLVPKWAPDLNSGYGIPLFIFHYPFPNYIGALFHTFGISFVDSFKLSLALGYFIAVIACFAWLKKLFSPFASTCAAIIFSVIPYWFVDIYVRGSVGEVWAIAWFFIGLAAIERKRYVIVSVAVALLVLSHNIMAMLLIPTLCLYIFIRNPGLILYVFGGIVLSAYFWLPAIVERSFMTGLNSVNFRDHFVQFFQLLFPSWGTGFSVREITGTEMSFQIGVIPLFVVLLSVFRLRKSQPLAVFFLLILLIAVSLTLGVTEPIWGWLGFMQFIQYPWRLLVFVLPATAFLGAYAVSSYPKWVAVGLSVLAVVFSVRYMRPVIYAPRSDAYYLGRPEFTDGTSSIANTFSTVWTGWKKERPGKKVQVVSGTANITAQNFTPLRSVFDVSVSQPSVIRVNTLYFPGWTVNVDKAPVPIEYQEEGIIDFSLEPGTHHVDVWFKETPVRMFANTVSIVGLAILVILGYTSKKYAYFNSHRTNVRGSQPAGDRAVYQRTRKRTY